MYGIHRVLHTPQSYLFIRGLRREKVKKKLPTTFTILSSVLFYDFFFCTPFANQFFRKTSHHLTYVKAFQRLRLSPGSGFTGEPEEWKRWFGWRSRSFIFSFTCYVSLLAASAYNMLCNWKEDENTKWDTATMNMFPMFIEHEHQHCKLIAN